MEEKILLSEILSLAVQMRTNPSDETAKQLDSIINKLIVRTYIPTASKGTIAAAIIDLVVTQPELDAITGSMQLYIGKYFYGILGYLVNCEDDVSVKPITTGVVDNMFSSGLIDYVLRFCNNDFQKLEHMIDDCMNFNNILRLLESCSYFNNDNLNKYEQLIKDFQETLTEPKLKYLNDLFINQSDDFKQLKQLLSETAMDRVNNIELDSVKK